MKISFKAQNNKILKSEGWWFESHSLLLLWQRVLAFRRILKRVIDWQFVMELFSFSLHSTDLTTIVLDMYINKALFMKVGYLYDAEEQYNILLSKFGVLANENN